MGRARFGTFPFLGVFVACARHRVDLRPSLLPYEFRQHYMDYDGWSLDRGGSRPVARIIKQYLDDWLSRKKQDVPEKR
jgi:hypothetical protein